jgi:iron complex outermembrane recepter protein
MMIAKQIGALLCALLTFAFATQGFAQTQTPPQLTITVSDSSAARIPNASVSLTHGNEARTFMTDKEGVVQASGLSTGEWTLTVRSDGFEDRQRPLIMQGVAQSINVTLDLAPVRQSVLVEAGRVASPIQLDASAAGGSYLDVSVRDLPFNLTVITQEYIQERGVTNLMEALELAPGVTTWADTGWIPAADIRGFSTTDAGVFMAREGIVQNSVPQSGRPLDAFMFDAVEVLKGPSSFSYGSGTAGASINSRTKEPRREFHTESLFGYESFGRTRVGFGINVPLTRTLAGRIDVSQSHGGTNVQRTQSTLRAVNTAVLWTPLEYVTVKAKGIYSWDKVSPYFSTPILNRKVDPNVDYIELASNTFLDPRVRTFNYNMVNATNAAMNKFGTLTTEVNLPEGWKARNNVYVATQHLDSINNEGMTFNQSTLKVTPSGYTFIGRRDLQVGNQLDLRNTYKFWGRSVSFTVGGRVDNNDQGRYGIAGAGTAGTPPVMDMLNPIEYSPLHTNFLKTADVNTNSKNAFFESMLRVTQKLTLSGGARLDHIRNNRHTISTGLDNLVSFHAVTGRYALSYALLPTITLYVGNTKAIQPAGTGINSTGATALVNINQTQAQFSLQPSRQWEGGVKASAWRERIEATLSYFNIRKHGILTQELIDGVTYIERVGKIKSEGVDFSFIATPIRHFTLQGDFVSNNGEYLVFQTVAAGVAVDRSGNKVARVPPVVWSVTPTVRFGPVSVNVSFRTRGASWNDSNNTQRLPPSTVMNSNISIRMAKGTRLTLTGRNLTDEVLINRGGIVAGATTARIGLPRNYGLQLTQTF